MIMSRCARGTSCRSL